jgi:D-alanine transaminase
MDIVYFNGSFVPKESVHISPDDRGFLFGDGIYEVMKWYAGFFYDHEGHVSRLKRSLREVRIDWPRADTFASLSGELIKLNDLSGSDALVYLQVTRGVAPRNHAFPDPQVDPTVYAFARQTGPSKEKLETGVTVLLTRDIRWSRCDIKSVALLANTLSFQQAHEKGMNECIFVRDGFITEGSRSNIFLVADSILYTYPESEFILPGITRKNIIRYAKEAGITVREVPFAEKDLSTLQEAFIVNTSSEVTPVSAFGDRLVGDGKPGPVTIMIHNKFIDELNSLKGR